ncbi:uncharacterized protein LOC143039439 isoform X2 [Oratosquilla oratoria]|uniref:uncharacterized protein LOC143039439 isoform X2 n=1 Tax=Oratosquilla oratoria TaxID=337810 RepID=UPI003F765294
MNASVKKPVPNNKSSTLLTNEENDTIFRLLGNRCVTLATAVVQMYGTEPPRHNQWHKRHCGVVTFTKDNVRRSYFIQVWDLMAGQKVFEQEQYNQFTYHDSKSFFHQFEAEDQMIGLNFANEQEAKLFHSAIQERIGAKQRKKEERRRQQQQQQQQHQQQHSPLPQQQKPQFQLPQTQNQAYQSQGDLEPNKSKKSTKGKNKGRAKLSKDQIGMPTDFKHVTHVGFDPDTGFSQFNTGSSQFTDDKLKVFFNMVGVSQQQLSDSRTREFIYDFIEKHGGIEAAVRETEAQRSLSTNSSSALPTPQSSGSPAVTPPTLPSRNAPVRAGAPPPPPRTTGAHPPLPPTSAPPLPSAAAPPTSTYHRAPVPPPPGVVSAHSPVSHKAAPPPPQSSSLGAPPPPPPPPTNTIPSHPKGRGAPPPPPPPPPSSSVPPPPPPPSTMPKQSNGPALPTVPSNRAALMDEIRIGANLKKVSPIEQTAPVDSHDKLLSEIREGIQLKAVSETQRDAPLKMEETGGMALLLAKALEDRAKFIQNESDSDATSDNSDDEDWEY